MQIYLPSNFSFCFKPSLRVKSIFRKKRFVLCARKSWTREVTSLLIILSLPAVNYFIYDMLVLSFRLFAIILIVKLANVKLANRVSFLTKPWGFFPHIFFCFILLQGGKKKCKLYFLHICHYFIFNQAPSLKRFEQKNNLRCTLLINFLSLVAF